MCFTRIWKSFCLWQEVVMKVLFILLCNSLFQYNTTFATQFSQMNIVNGIAMLVLFGQLILYFSLHFHSILVTKYFTQFLLLNSLFNSCLNMIFTCLLCLNKKYCMLAVHYIIHCTMKSCNCSYCPNGFFMM